MLENVRVATSYSIPEIQIFVENLFPLVGFAVCNSKVHREKTNGDDHEATRTGGVSVFSNGLVKDNLHDRCHHTGQVFWLVLGSEDKTACDSTDAAHSSQRRGAKRPLPLAADIVCLTKSAGAESVFECLT